MNWVFETYSNVYNTAMMQDMHTSRNAAVAQKATVRTKIARLFGHG